ncbi:MAG: cytochrome P450 [Candidatus Rokuibacteriota bacterium]|nr:MAG: cytochrome P450 [Candidatus Rokubacteria bacterium]
MNEEILFNPLLPEFHADPYPFYKRLREKEPIHQSPLGFWVLTRYEDCVAVLRDQRFGREEFQQMLTAVYGDETEKPALPRSMLFRDPPDHTRLRALVSKAFTPRMIETMREHIQEIVDRLLDRVQDAGRMDVIEDLAYPLPVTVICEMLGVPVADHASIRGWSAEIARSLDAIGLPSDEGIVERGRRSRRALADYFRRLVPERRARPQNDLLSGLLAAEEHGDKLSPDEVIAMCLLLFIAGHETTVNLIGNGTLALLRHPEQLKKLRAEPSRIGNAVEELLRYDSPVQRTARITTTEVELAGQPLAKGTMVITALGAANRDPAQFADPDRLDVTRKDPRHISFGFGIHFCLGAPLARVEGQLALGTLLRRAPNLALAESKLEWRESSVLRGLKRLNVTF